MSHFRYGAHVHANGIRQHYLCYCSATAENRGLPPVIIVPGITSPAVTWGFVAERLASKVDTYVLDVRGRGLSAAGTHLDYSLDAQAADLIALAEALGLKQYSVVGHSMGARIAIRAARTQPEGLTRAVLVDPPMSGPGRRPYPANLSWYTDSIQQAQKGIDLHAMRTFCPSWTDEQLILRAQWLHTCDERAVRISFDGFHSDDVHADLGNLRCPSLLITAGRGDVVRDEDVSECLQLAPAMSHARVAGAGHMIPWDDEEGFYKAFSSFLGCYLTDRTGD
jgi:N-formylmaleamate deformylase